MKPDRDGIWEWFSRDGLKRLVAVCNVGTEKDPWLRVYWAGGYYDVNADEGPPGAEWPGPWGNRIGDHGCVPDVELYLFPD